MCDHALTPSNLALKMVGVHLVSWLSRVEQFHVVFQKSCGLWESSAHNPAGRSRIIKEYKDVCMDGCMYGWMDGWMC